MELVHGIEYTKPQIILLQDTGLGVCEMSARTCYDSFDMSENAEITDLNEMIDSIKDGDWGIEDIAKQELLDGMNKIESSELLDDLAWTYFHHSILEHTNISFLVKGTSRGVLQEHARHRIQAISVRSTRYTMSGIINAFVASTSYTLGINFFTDKLLELDMFVTSNKEYNKCEIEGIYLKLQYQLRVLGKEEFMKIAVAKSSLPFLETLSGHDLYEALQTGKKKRNVGDAFKHIVTDNWKVDMVVTFNMRSLKNYFTLRDSGAAFFQIQWLAQQMKEATPQKYLDLIIKAKKDT